MRMMHYLDSARIDMKGVFDKLMDTIDLLFYLVDHSNEGSREDITLSVLLHDIGHLLSKYRQKYTMISICSRWANASIRNLTNI